MTKISCETGKQFSGIHFRSPLIYTQLSKDIDNDTYQPKAVPPETPDKSNKITLKEHSNDSTLSLEHNVLSLTSVLD